MLGFYQVSNLFKNTKHKFMGLKLAGTRTLHDHMFNKLSSVYSNVSFLKVSKPGDISPELTCINFID